MEVAESTHTVVATGAQTDRAAGWCLERFAQWCPVNIEFSSCAGCCVKFFQLIDLARDVQKRTEFCVAHGVFRISGLKCPKCGCELQHYVDNAFKCVSKIKKAHKQKRSTRKGCQYQSSVFKGTYFENNKLSMEKIILFTVLFFTEVKCRSKFISTELDLSSSTYTDWTSHTREVCVNYIKETSDVILGGPGISVEVNTLKCGNNWVFGAVDRYDTSKFFFIPIKDKSLQALLNIVKQKIHRGTIIVSHCLKMCRGLKSEGYKHVPVKNAACIDPKTGAHIQNLLSKWQDISEGMTTQMKRKEIIEGCIAEQIFKHKFKNLDDRIHNFFEHVGKMYPPACGAATV